MLSNFSLQHIDPSLSSSTATASPDQMVSSYEPLIPSPDQMVSSYEPLIPLPDQMVSSYEPLIPSSVSSPTTISTNNDNSISVQTGHPMITRDKYGIFKRLYTASTISTTILKSLQQVIQTSHWFQAMIEEYNALIYNNTWDLVTPPTGVTPIRCKWVFKTKYNVDGSLQRHKAKMVAKGFHQQHDTKYLETFSPVVKPTTTFVQFSLLHLQIVGLFII